MKCQKCGRNEVNFHYSSNENGHVTQMHLCSQCATESGYNIDQLFGNMFTGMFLMPGLIPVLTGRQTKPEALCKCGCAALTPDVKDIEVNEKLKERRELNKQMRIAAQNEEFEKAAEIRDRLKELET